MKRILFTIFFLLWCGSAWGATYYVDSNIIDVNVESDTPDCTTYDPVSFSTSGGTDNAFATIADINSLLLAAGDSVLFRAGNTWRETLTVSASGDSGNPITFSSYGNSPALLRKPVLYGDNPFATSAKLKLLRDVIKINETYWIFTEALNGTIWEIYYSTSANGIDFQTLSGSLFSPGNAGEFDELGQADPTVIYDGPGDWKMYYDAEDGSGIWSLGYATSADGVSWNKVGKILEKSESGWDSGGLHHPVALKHNGVYYLYFSANSAGPMGDLGIAISTDGVSWEKYDGNPILEREVGEFDSNYLRPSRPVFINGLWYMLYWGRDGVVSKMGIATSTDLLTWTKQGVYVGMPDNTQASSPIIEGETLKIYYLTSPDGYTNNLAFVDISNFDYPAISGADIVRKFNVAQVNQGGEDTTPDYGNFSANYLYGIKITSGASATSFDGYYYYSGAATRAKKIALYTDNSGPDNLVVGSDTDELTTVGSGWKSESTRSSVTISPSTNYWIVFWADVNWSGPKSSVDGDPADNDWFNKELTYDGNFPATITGEAIFDRGDPSGCFLYKTLSSTYFSPLANEPNIVLFDKDFGEKKATLADVTSEGDWIWTTGLFSVDALFFYGSGIPDATYNSPGIEVGQRAYTINNNLQDYIVFDRLNISGGNTSNILLDGANISTVQFGILENGNSGAEIDSAGGKIYNSIISKNITGVDVDATGTITNTIIFGNTAGINEDGGTATITYSVLQAAHAGAGNIIGTPVLNDNYSLPVSSPLINAGTKAGIVSFTGTQEDYFGHEYFFAPYDRLNIGADQEYSDAYLRPNRQGIVLRTWR